MKQAVAVTLDRHPWWVKLVSETGEESRIDIGQDPGQQFGAFPVSSAELRDLAAFLSEAALLMDRAFRARGRNNAD